MLEMLHAESSSPCCDLLLCASTRKLSAKWPPNGCCSLLPYTTLPWLQVDMALTQLPAPPGKSNVTKQQFLDAVLAAKEYILVRKLTFELESRLC
jgi:hypothetical protein